MTKRKITLGTTYYNNPEAIKVFINKHLPYVDELIIVDDGSQEYPLIDIVHPTSKIKIFRIKKDYGFNSHGCRNLIMSKTSNEWVVLLDSDRELMDPEYSFDFIKRSSLKYDHRYTFVAHSINPGQDIHESVNDYLISKQHFFSVGGYDEEYIGMRYGDRQFFGQLSRTGKDTNISSINLLLKRASTYDTMLKNNTSDVTASPNDIGVRCAVADEIVEKRLINLQPDKKILTFAWEEVLVDQKEDISISPSAI